MDPRFPPARLGPKRGLMKLDQAHRAACRSQVVGQQHPLRLESVLRPPAASREAVRHQLILRQHLPPGPPQENVYLLLINRALHPEIRAKVLLLHYLWVLIETHRPGLL